MGVLGAGVVVHARAPRREPLPQSCTRRRRRQVSLSRVGPLSEIAAKVRTATLTGARTTGSRSRLVEELRQSLPPEDQALLILRVNRKLDWKEIAQVMVYEGKLVEGAVLEKEAARLRKRYQLRQGQAPAHGRAALGRGFGESISVVRAPAYRVPLNASFSVWITWLVTTSAVTVSIS